MSRGVEVLEKANMRAPVLSKEQKWEPSSVVGG